MRLREGTVEVSPGRRVGYAEYGVRGEPVVLLFHGSPGGRFYDLSASALVEVGVSLFSLERPGFGLSDSFPGRTLSGWADDVASVVDALGVGRFGIVGVSGGAPYALVVARALPDRVAAVALMCPCCVQPQDANLDELLPASFSEGIIRYRTDRAGALAAEQQRLDDRARRWADDPIGFFDDMFGSVPIEDPTAVERFRAKWLGVLAASYGSAPDTDEFRVLAETWGFDMEEVTVPVHAWHGDADSSVPLGLTQHAVTALPNAQLTICPGEGHRLAPTHHRAVLEFLRGHL